VDEAGGGEAPGAPVVRLPEAAAAVRAGGVVRPRGLEPRPGRGVSVLVADQAAAVRTAPALLAVDADQDADLPSVEIGLGPARRPRLAPDGGGPLEPAELGGVAGDEVPLGACGAICPPLAEPGGVGPAPHDRHGCVGNDGLHLAWPFGQQVLGAHHEDAVAVAVVEPVDGGRGDPGLADPHLPHQQGCPLLPQRPGDALRHVGLRAVQGLGEAADGWVNLLAGSQPRLVALLRPLRPAGSPTPPDTRPGCRRPCPGRPDRRRGSARAPGRPSRTVPARRVPAVSAAGPRAWPPGRRGPSGSGPPGPPAACRGAARPTRAEAAGRCWPAATAAAPPRDPRPSPGTGRPRPAGAGATSR
jgi:hypothetical protein